MKCSLFHKWNIGQNAAEIYQLSKTMKGDGLMMYRSSLGSFSGLLFWGHCLLMQNNAPKKVSFQIGEEWESKQGKIMGSDQSVDRTSSTKPKLSMWVIIWTYIVLKRGALGFLVLQIRPIFGSVFRFSLSKVAVFRFWYFMRFADFLQFSCRFSVFANNDGGFSDSSA